MLLVEFIFCFFLGGRKLSGEYLTWRFRPFAVLAFSLKNTVMLIAYLIINTIPISRGPVPLMLCYPSPH